MSEKRKLLLADDSITIQKVVNLTFADEGIEVISVGDGDSAMRKFDEFMPDLVMADVNMPGLSGYEVCRIIKRTEETQDIPVILLVGSFEPFDEGAAKDAGADDFLTKPFQSIRQLVNKVTDLLNRREQPAGAPPAEESPAPADSFAETLEFEKQQEAPETSQPTPETAAPVFEAPRESAASVSSESDASNAYAENMPEFSSEFGDAGMDDEMIETSAAGEYASDSVAADRPESATDYGVTQQMSAEEFKSFDIPAGEISEPEAPREDENQYSSAESFEPAADSSELPPSFDEEARKMGFMAQNYAQETQDRPEIAETEPQIDYYLPHDEEFSAEPEFEQEITDAETLEPEVSYESESPRTPDFSQAPEEDQSEGEATREAAGADDESGATEAANEYAEDITGTEQPGVAEETRLREVSEGAEAMPEAEIDLSRVGETMEEPQIAPAEPETEPVAVDAEAENEEAYETARYVDEAPAETAREEEIDAEMPIAADAPHAPALDLDEGDLLELPPLVEETGIRPQPKPQTLLPEVVAQPAAVEPGSKITVTKTVAESEIALTFPPELIEAIAQKVADKISAKTLSEVLPQITELVVKKLAEERKE